jgi:hypothetical protein
MGLITDTQKRAGETKQIPIYLLNGTKNGTVNRDESEHDEASNDPEIGTAKEAQNRNSSENGNSTVFPLNSTVFPHKVSRFSLETVPKTGHGKIKERSEPSKEPKSITPAAIPDWVPADAWKAFVEMRQKIRKPLTEYAKKLAVDELKKLVDEGQDVTAVINQSVLKSWQGFFAVKTAANGTVNKHGGFSSQDYRAGVTDDGLF